MLKYHKAEVEDLSEKFWNGHGYFGNSTEPDNTNESRYRRIQSLGGFKVQCVECLRWRSLLHKDFKDGNFFPEDDWKCNDYDGLSCTNAEETKNIPMYKDKPASSRNNSSRNKSNTNSESEYLPHENASHPNSFKQLSRPSAKILNYTKSSAKKISLINENSNRLSQCSVNFDRHSDAAAFEDETITQSCNSTVDLFKQDNRYSSRRLIEENLDFNNQMSSSPRHSTESRDSLYSFADGASVITNQTNLTIHEIYSNASEFTSRRSTIDSSFSESNFSNKRKIKSEGVEESGDDYSTKRSKSRDKFWIDHVRKQTRCNLNVSALNEEKKAIFDKKLGEFNSRENYKIIEEIELAARNNLERLKVSYHNIGQKLDKVGQKLEKVGDVVKKGPYKTYEEMKMAMKKIEDIINPNNKNNYLQQEEMYDALTPGTDSNTNTGYEDLHTIIID